MLAVPVALRNRRRVLGHQVVNVLLDFVLVHDTCTYRWLLMMALICLLAIMSDCYKLLLSSLDIIVSGPIRIESRFLLTFYWSTSRQEYWLDWVLAYGSEQWCAWCRWTGCWLFLPPIHTPAGTDCPASNSSPSSLLHECSSPAYFSSTPPCTPILLWWYPPVHGRCFTRLRAEDCTLT